MYLFYISILSLMPRNFESCATTARLAPACVFTPDSAELVADAVNLFRENNCSFAVRSGGHSPSKGWANIDGGVLLATTDLNNLTLGDNHVSVGAGLRWGSVYDFLDPHGLVVIGGRGAGVGVSGLVLGGGVSHFTPMRGLACDNVKGFEIVTVDGQILQANAETHTDLWQALKGGQNMFGVVTRFDLYTYPSPRMHDLSGQVPMTDFDQVADAYDSYINRHSGEDAAAALAVSLTSYYVTFLGDPFLQVDALNTAGDGGGPGYQQPWITNNVTRELRLPAPLVDLQGLPFKSVSEKWGTMAELAAGAETPALRYDLRTMSFRSSPEMLKRMKAIFEDEVAGLSGTVANFSGIVEWQLVTERAITQGIKKGSNVLGLEGSGPLILFAMANSWSSAAGDEAAYGAGQRIVERGEVLAKELGLHVPFVYANYAASGQDVIASYGAENLLKLSKVRAKYDPEDKLSRILPGGLSGQTTL
ncbi:hypothetical protein EsH8_X_000648 [Colletotrichum jinshuiense]